MNVIYENSTDDELGSCWSCIPTIAKESPCVLQAIKEKSFKPLLNCGVTKADVSDHYLPPVPVFISGTSVRFNALDAFADVILRSFHPPSCAIASTVFPACSRSLSSPFAKTTQSPASRRSRTRRVRPRELPTPTSTSRDSRARFSSRPLKTSRPSTSARAARAAVALAASAVVSLVSVWEFVPPKKETKESKGGGGCKAVTYLGEEGLHPLPPLRVFFFGLIQILLSRNTTLLEDRNKTHLAIHM